MTLCRIQKIINFGNGISTLTMFDYVPILLDILNIQIQLKIAEL